MKSRIVLTILVLQSILLTIIASTEQPDRPYFLFRCDDSEEDEGESEGDSGKGSSSASGDGENGTRYGVADGYMPYPTRRKRRRAITGSSSKATKESKGTGSSSKAKATKESEGTSSSSKPTKETGSSSKATKAGSLFPKCSKSKGSKTPTSNSSESSGGTSGTGSKASKSGSQSSSSGDSSSSGSDNIASASSPTTRPTTRKPTPAAVTVPAAGYQPYKGTPKPTPKPVTEALAFSTSSSCDALSDGQVVKTNTKATLTYTYEAAVRDEAEVVWITEDMEDRIALYAGRELMDCDDRRRLLHSTLVGRRLGDLEVVGVDSSEPLDAVDEGKSCTYLTGQNKIDDTTCHVINGGMTLYLGESESMRKLSEEEDEELEESTEDALEAIMEAMNDEKSPFLEEMDGDYAVSGLMGVRFASGTTNEGDEIEDEDGKIDSDRAGPANGAEEGGATIQSSKAAAIGGSLLGLGLVALVVLGLVVVVRNKLRPDRYNEFDNEDNNDLDDKDTDIDTASMKSTPSPNKAYVVGEEGSIYTNATHDTRFLFNSAYESGNGNDDGQQVDVHHCTSAMCPICNGKETMFINANDEQSEESSEPEGYEFSYDPRRGGSNASSTSRSMMKRSLAYEPKEDVSNPSFDNPSEMSERPYIVDDTVDF